MVYLGIIIFFIIVAFLIRYEPKIDLVVSNKKYIFLLWYNKYDKKYVKRAYIQLFELK